MTENKDLTKKKFKHKTLKYNKFKLLQNVHITSYPRMGSLGWNLVGVFYTGK
jgi:hypothetical protein